MSLLRKLQAGLREAGNLEADMDLIRGLRDHARYMADELEPFCLSQERDTDLIRALISAVEGSSNVDRKQVLAKARAKLLETEK